MSLLLLFGSAAAPATTTPDVTTVSTVSPNYSYANLKAAVNGRIHGKVGMLLDVRSSINNAVREIWSIVDFKSAIRSAVMAPNLVQDNYQYACPTDAQMDNLIDLQRQTLDRSRFEDWTLTTEAEFDRYKLDPNRMLVAFSHRSMIRTLLASAPIESSSVTASTLDVVTGWTAVGDATNLRTDAQNFILGQGSIKFDLNAAGATAGITNSALASYDLTNYLSNGSVFVWVYLTSISGVSGFTVKLGSSASNYLSQSLTATAGGTGFQVGWNQLRFDLSSATTTGTPNTAACTFASVYMTKTTGKTADTGYRFDSIVIKNGKFYNLIYYTAYPWQTAAGVYIENSTVDTDLLNVTGEEYQLIIEKCVELIGYEAREAQDASIAINRLGTPMGTPPPQMKWGLIANYQMSNPSEAMLLTTEYHSFSSIDGDDQMFGGQL